MIRPQAFPVPFAQGLDQKTDPKQVQIGKFLSLQNSIFQKGGLLQKRNGFGQLASLPNASSTYLTTFNGNLTAIGSSVSALNANTETWVEKGTYQPMEEATLPLIRNSLNQIQSDTAIANNMVCTTYTTQNNGSNQYYYAIADATTGQNIIEPTIIPAISSGTISGSSRVFVVGKYFVIVSPVTILSTVYLQYISTAINTPILSLPQNLCADSYSAITTNPGWDGAVSNDTLVVAYNTTSAGQGVHVTSLTQAQIAANQESSVIHQFTGAAYIANVLSICVDITANPNIFYISFWNSATSNGYTCAVYVGFGSINTQFTPKQIITGVAVTNLASAAQNGVCTVFSEVANNYGYDASIPTHFIDAVTVSNAGVAGIPYIVVRSVGLASKAFIVNGSIFFLSAFQSPFQDTYFLINGTLSVEAAPIVIAKLAYENGGGYVLRGLPSVTVTDSNVAQISYLYKDLIEALNTLDNTQQTTAGGIYSQTGINLVTFTIGTETVSSTEIGNNLNLGGGFGWMYDGYLPVEQNFFLWPDSVEATWSATGGSIHAQPDNTTNTDAYYYQAVYEWSDNQGNIFRSAPSIPVAVTTTGTGTAGSITVDVPTLRLTYKIANPLKVVLYRWSVANPVYYQVTSITAPLLNNTTIDYVTFVDTQADADIIGNSIIYTTGGVVEDVNPPAYSITTLFDTRQWILDAEDRNLFWYSKQIIEGTPVEFSDLFTYYVAPNSGTTSSTGPVTAAFPMDDKLVIWKANAIYYINGSGPDNAGANSTYSPSPIFITSTVGCVSQNSIVFTPSGLQFQSEDGIWQLGRDLSTTYIGAPVEGFNSSGVLSAVNVPATTQIRFTLDTGQHLMYDYYYENWGTFVGIPAISSCIYQGLHTFLNSYGQVYQETPGVYLDGSNPTLLSFVTGWIQLQGISGYQALFELQLLGQYFSPHLLNFQIGYDFGALSEQVLIEPINYTGVYGSDDLYGQTSPYGGPGSLEQWRIQPGQQNCQAFQISVQEVYDPQFGNLAGAGFTMSALTVVLGLTRSYRPLRATDTAGTSN